MTSFWRPLGISIVAGLLLYWLLFFQLGSHTPGLNIAEAQAAQNSSSLATIISNPLYAPHKLVQYALQRTSLTGTFAVRAASALFGVLSIGLLFNILRKWHTKRIALLGSLLFGTSSWFLHTARFATPDILIITSLLALVAIGMWLRDTRQRLISLLLALGVMAALLYVPGMILLVPACLIWQRRLIQQELRHISAWIIALGAIIAGVLVTPLLMAIVRQPELLRPLLGLPPSLQAVIEFGRTVVFIPIRLFLKGPDNPALWLGRLPLLDVFVAIMLIMGAYAYRFKLTLDRTKFLLVAILIVSVLIGLQGSIPLSALLPFIYLVAASGIALMLQQWFTIFPRNPLARTAGASLLTIAVLLACFYHINHYFIAWPNAPETKAAFTEQGK